MGDSATGDANKAEAPPTAEIATEEAPKGEDAAETEAKKFFRVIDHPHLGMNLKKGQVYSLQDLHRKCRHNKAKLRLLEQTLKKPKVFQPVTEEEAAKDKEAKEPASKEEEGKDEDKDGEAEGGEGDAGDEEKPKNFKVVGRPNLGLNLRMGEVYTRDALVERCAGDKAKVKKLEQQLKKPKIFEPAEADAEAKASKGKAAKAKAKAKARPKSAAKAAAKRKADPKGKAEAAKKKKVS